MVKVRVIGNNKGQIGPQALEDIPAAMIAMLAGVAVIAILFGIYTNHSGPASITDMHYAGKRLLEKSVFQDLSSEQSRSFGNLVLDRENLDSGVTLHSIEYGLHLTVSYWDKEFEYGEEAPAGGKHTYGYPITVFDDRVLYNGLAVLTIWKK